MQKWCQLIASTPEGPAAPKSEEQLIESWDHLKPQRLWDGKEQTLILLTLNYPVMVVEQEGLSPSRYHEPGNLGQMDLSDHSAGEGSLVSVQ